MADQSTTSIYFYVNGVLEAMMQLPQGDPPAIGNRQSFHSQAIVLPCTDPRGSTTRVCRTTTYQGLRYMVDMPAATSQERRVGVWGFRERIDSTPIWTQEGQILSEDPVGDFTYEEEEDPFQASPQQHQQPRSSIQPTHVTQPSLSPSPASSAATASSSSSSTAATDVSTRTRLPPAATHRPGGRFSSSSSARTAASRRADDWLKRLIEDNEAQASEDSPSRQTGKRRKTQQQPDQPNVQHQRQTAVATAAEEGPVTLKNAAAEGEEAEAAASVHEAPVAEERGAAAEDEAAANEGGQVTVEVAAEERLEEPVASAPSAAAQWNSAASAAAAKLPVEQPEEPAAEEAETEAQDENVEMPALGDDYAGYDAPSPTASLVSGPTVAPTLAQPVFMYKPRQGQRRFMGLPTEARGSIAVKLAFWRGRMIDTRTEAAMKGLSAIALPDCTLPGRNMPADAREQQQRRIESETGQMVHSEIGGHVFIVMLKVWLEALINKSSRLDLQWLFNSISVGDIAAIYFHQFAFPEIIYIRDEDDLLAFLAANPDANARLYKCAGTYLGFTIWRIAGVRKMSWYVGEATDQTIAERIKQHERERQLMKEGKLVTLFLHGQQGHYVPGEEVEHHYVILTGSPAGKSKTAQQEKLDELVKSVTGLTIKKTTGGRELSPKYSITLNNSLNEHIGCCLFDSVWHRYDGIIKLDGARLGTRQPHQGANAVTPYVAFSTMTCSKATKAKAAGKVRGRVTRANEDNLEAQLEAAVRGGGLTSSSKSAASQLAPAYSSSAVASSSTLSSRPAAGAAPAASATDSATSAALSSTSTAADPDILTPAAIEALTPAALESLALPAASESQLTAALAVTESQDTSLFNNPTMSEEERKQADVSLAQGHHCVIINGYLIISFSGEEEMELDLMDMILEDDVQWIPDGHAKLRVERGFRSWACQPLSGGVEARWVLANYKLSVMHNVKRHPVNVAPFGEVLSYRWDKALRRVAEAKIGDDECKALPRGIRWPGSAVVDGVGIGVRFCGARFTLRKIRQKSGKEALAFELPDCGDDGATWRRLGMTSDVSSAGVALTTDTLKAGDDVVVKICDTKTSRMTSLLAAPRKTSKDGTPNSKPIGDREWKSLGDASSGWQVLFLINLAREQEGLPLLQPSQVE